MNQVTVDWRISDRARDQRSWSISEVWALNGRRGFAGWAGINCMDWAAGDDGDRPIYGRAWDQQSGLGGLVHMGFVAL